MSSSHRIGMLLLPLTLTLAVGQAFAGLPETARPPNAKAKARPKAETVVNVKEFGARGDARAFAKAATTAKSTAFTIADGNLSATDVGKTIGIFEAGVGGRSHVSTIAAIASPTSGTLAAPAVGAVAGKRCYVGTNDEPAFEKAAAALQKRGSGTFLIPRSDGHYLVSKPGLAMSADFAVCDWSNLDGVRIRCDEAKIISPDEYSTGPFSWRMFKFTSCRDVKIAGLNFEGVWKEDEYTNHCGVTLTTFQRNCRDITLQIRAKGIAYGVWSGTFGKLADGGSSNWTIDFKGSHLDFPVAFWNAGHHSKLDIDVEWIHRAVYAAGTDDCAGTVRVRNFEAPVAVVLSDAFDGSPKTAKTGVFAKNVDLKIIDTGTNDRSDGVIHYWAGLACATDVAASAGGDIKLKVEATLKRDSRADLGGFLVATNGFSPGVYNSAVTLSNVQFGGVIDRSAYPSSKKSYIAVVGSGDTHSGLTLNHFAFRDLTVKENTADPAGNSILMQLPTIGTDVVFEKVRGVSTPIRIGRPRDGNRRFIFRECVGTKPPRSGYVVRSGT